MANITCPPGEEPERIRKRIDRLFQKLDEAYPDKCIVGLYANHKKWGETVTELYRELGYEDGQSFLKAYGYTMGTAPIGGRPSTVDPIVEIAKLKERYPGGTCKSIGMLQQENPDIPWKSLSNRSNEYFGMPLSKYLQQEGILPVKKTKEAAKEKSVLQLRREMSDEDRLAEIEKALLEKYAGKEDLPTSVARLKSENKELKISSIDTLIKKVKGLSAKEYFTALGIMPVEKTDEEKFEEIITTLKNRYLDKEEKEFFLHDLIKQNQDLDFSNLQYLTRKVAGKRLVTYLMEQGILSNWAEHERLKREEWIKNFKNNLSFAELYEDYKRTYTCQEQEIRDGSINALLGISSKYDSRMLDWVYAFIHQKNKQFFEQCKTTFKLAPNAFVTAALVILNNKCKPSDINKVGEVVFDLRKEIGQDFLDQFFAFAKNRNAKDAVSALSPFASDTVGGERGIGKEFKSQLAEFCYNNFTMHDFERVMKLSGLKDIDFKGSGVKYADSDEEVSAFELECAFIPYIGQMKEKPRRIGDYKTEFCRLHILNDSDYVASNFDKSSFETFIDKFSEYSCGYVNPQLWIPVCRFGAGKQIKKLITSMNSWSDWYTCAANGRSAIIVCRGAIMLSDTREAMMYAEKCRNLDYYARIRGTTEDIIRDTRLADFGFDSDGKKKYDLGNTIIEASVGDDLGIVLCDVATSKIVKSLPKKGNDPGKYDLCSKDYADLKRNVKKVVKTRTDLLFDYFLSGRGHNCKSWIAAYTENPVLNKVARLLVWAQGDKTFTIGETGIVDSFENSFEPDENIDVIVAHPLEMDDGDIIRWQKYFIQHNLKQPFEQIWEPKINGRVRADRYAECKIPYYRFQHQEKHGIFVEDRDFHNDIVITLKDCDAQIERIDWMRRHSINYSESFEIKSIHIKRQSRYSNHIIFYFDKCTIFEQIGNDEDSLLKNLSGYTVAQIDAFLKYAIEKGSTKCTAILLNYKNEHFADFVDVEEFTLDL